MALRCVFLAGGLAALLAGCDDQGFSRAGDEWDRRRAGPYYVVSAAHDRAVVSAKGRQVAIEPAEGFCLARESVEASRLSAFALIGDCALDTPTDGAPRGARGELKLPRSLPGIITVSVSGDPGFAGSASDDALAGLSSYIETPEGRELLGRGGPGSEVTVIESRRIDDGVYVRVDDGTDGVVPVLDSEFWRAFVEVNDRLAVVTVSGFRDRPIGTEEMLKHLVRQVETLQVANARPINEPGIQVAAADRDRSSGRQTLSDVQADPVLVVTAENLQPPESAAPLERPTEAEEAALEALLASAAAEEGGVGSDVAGADDAPVAPYESVMPPRAARAAPEAAVAQVSAVAEAPEAETAALAPDLPTPAPAVAPVQAAATPGSTVPLPRPSAASPASPAEAETETAPELAPTRYAPRSSPQAPRRPRNV